MAGVILTGRWICGPGGRSSAGQMPSGCRTQCKSVGQTLLSAKLWAFFACIILYIHCEMLLLIHDSVCSNICLLQDARNWWKQVDPTPYPNNTSKADKTPLHPWLIFLPGSLHKGTCLQTCCTPISQWVLQGIQELLRRFAILTKQWEWSSTHADNRWTAFAKIDHKWSRHDRSFSLAWI